MANQQIIVSFLLSFFVISGLRPFLPELSLRGRLAYLRGLCTNSYLQVNHKISNDDDIFKKRHLSQIAIPDTRRGHKVFGKIKRLENTL